MKVSFSNLGLGTIFFKIKDNDFEIEDCAYSNYFQNLSSFPYVLYDLSTLVFIETKIVFYAEPSAYELFFHKRDNIISFKIYFSKNYTWTGFDNKLIYEKSGSFKEICYPFWRALRELQSHYTEEEFKEKWEEHFSYDELNTLSKIIKK